MKAPERYYLGIDIGSTTVKSVVLSATGEILYSSYERHNARIRETLLKELQEVDAAFPTAVFVLALTGSAGLGLAEKAGLPFVQEVAGTYLAVERFYPKSDVVVELGGEDAKIIFLTGGTEERMNGTCAGGTGAFIDQMASLLDVSTDELDRLALNAKQIYPIASRCGVFAKSDIQPLLNQGARKEDIAASIYYAVVGQTISGLAQGRKIQGQVLFLGGPLSFLKGLQNAFTQTLKLTPENALFPKEGRLFVGIGAALYAMKAGEEHQLKELISRLKNAPSEDSLKAAKPLFENEEEYRAFKEEHDNVNIPSFPLENYQGKAYLGIDAGSTTTKMVLLSANHEILYSQYALNKGSPLDGIALQLRGLYERMPSDVEIVSSCVIGYGEDLIRSAFNVSYGLVETIAHYFAARYFAPDVDFVIDIGGQRQSQDNQLIGKIGTIEEINIGPGKDFPLNRANQLAVFRNHVRPVEDVSFNAAIEIVDVQFRMEKGEAFLHIALEVTLEIDLESMEKREEILFDENKFVAAKIADMEAMAETKELSFHVVFCIAVLVVNIVLLRPRKEPFTNRQSHSVPPSYAELSMMPAPKKEQSF